MPVSPQPPGSSLLRLRAQTLLRTEGGRQAIHAYRELLAIEPTRADDWFNLGYLLRRTAQWSESLAAYAKAIEQGLGRPEEAHLNRAVIFSEHLFDVAAAEAELRAALTVAPDFLPALLNLANLKEDLGDRSAARLAYERALLIHPGDVRALGRLAELADIDELKLILSRLDARLAEPTSHEERAELLFAQARSLDRLDRHEDAFTVLLEANDLVRTLAARAGWTYRAEERERLVDAILAEPCGNELDPHCIRPPLFLCGMFRSGTTVLEQVLGAHPDLCAAGELDALPRIVAERLPRFPQGMNALSAADLTAMRSAYVGTLNRLGCGERTIIDKRPDNFIYLAFAKRLFPDARIVITRRDPLDVILSNLFLRFDDSVTYSSRMEDVAHWLIQERRLARHWQRMFPGSILEVDYDQLVANPAPAIARVLDFLGLPPNDACLRFHERRTTIRTPSGWQARQPLHARSSGRWRRYQIQLGPAIAMLERAGLA